MSYKEEIVLFILVFIAGATLGFIFGSFDGFQECFEMPRSTEFVVESANIEEVTTNTGLVVQNDGFNVGDTLVIRKK